VGYLLKLEFTKYENSKYCIAIHCSYEAGWGQEKTFNKCETSHVGKVNLDVIINAVKYYPENTSLVGYLMTLSILKLYSVRKLILMQQHN
jgi:hypothetical protein